MKSVFEFFFKFKPIVFERGDWTWAGFSSPLFLVTMLALALGFAYLQWRWLRGPAQTLSTRRRTEWGSVPKGNSAVIRRNLSRWSMATLR